MPVGVFSSARFGCNPKPGVEDSSFQTRAARRKLPANTNRPINLICKTIYVYISGLEKTQDLLKKPAGRLNEGFFTGFSGKTGFLKEAFSLKISIFGG
jgi:hypothetical protein